MDTTCYRSSETVREPHSLPASTFKFNSVITLMAHCAPLGSDGCEDKKWGFIDGAAQTLSRYREEKLSNNNAHLLGSPAANETVLIRRI